MQNVYVKVNKRLKRVSYVSVLIICKINIFSGLVINSIALNGIKDQCLRNVKKKERQNIVANLKQVGKVGIDCTNIEDLYGVPLYVFPKIE